MIPLQKQSTRRRSPGKEPDNLTTLCTSHHELAHQMAFGIDEQVLWLRALVVECGLYEGLVI